MTTAAVERNGQHAQAPSASMKIAVTMVAVHMILNLEKDRKDRTTKHYYDHETALMHDIKKAGIRNPLKAYAKGELFQLVCGQTRLNAARRGGLSEAPVTMLTGEITPSRLLIEELADNNATEAFDAVAQAEIYLQLMKENGWTTQAELCRNVPIIKAGSACKALSIFETLIEELKLKLRSGVFGTRLGYALSRIASDQQIPTYEIVKDMKVEAAEEHIAEKFQGKKKAKKERPIKVTFGGITLLIAVQDFSKIFSCFSALDAAAKQAQKLGLTPASIQALLKSA